MTSAARVYRSLLRLYPGSYRRAFGAQMLQTFVDWHDDVARTHGHVGIGLWLPMIADEARNIASQRLASLATDDGLRIAGPALALLVFLLLVTGIAGSDALPRHAGR